MRLKGKKAMDVSPLNVVIAAAILLIVIVVVIAVFTRLFGREAEQIEGQISGLDDTDGDRIINMFDKCPCRAGEKENDGCPLGVTPPDPKPKTCP
jgi:hypothetical protein